MELVLDTRRVRNYPSARFSDERDLEYLCAIHGLRYELGTELMPTAELRNRFHETFTDKQFAHERDPHAWTTYLEGYEQLLKDRRALSEGPIHDLLYGSVSAIAILCACAHHEDCHRSYAIGAIQTYVPGIDVRVLYPEGKSPKRESPRRYRLHPFPHAGLPADLPKGANR